MIKIKKYQIEDYISDATQNALDLKADLVDGKVPSSQLPSYVDDVIEVANYAALPIPGETGVIYITLDTNKVYRWTGSVYVEIASGSTNLSYTPGVSNGTVNSDTGSDAVIPLAGLVNAGLFSAEEKNKLAAITGTNTGDQNLQSVTNLGATTTNPITANSFVKSGGTSSQFLKADGSVDSTSYTTAQNLQQVTDLGASTDNSILITVLDDDALNANSETGIAVYGYSNNNSGIVGESSNGVAVSGWSNNGIGGEFISNNNEKGIRVTANDDTVAEFNQSLGNKGLIINSGTSSIGNFIELAKNGINKLTVNQAGELTAQKLIKDGGTSSQILAADGSVITAGTNITITGGQISSVGGSGGGGSSVNYYLNGGTSQGTFGGTTYYEFSKTAVIGTGADFSRGTNGYIASFITDVADPSLLLIPAGNWNLEFFFSASSNGGTPSFYVELYKYDGTTFTSIASNSTNPERITNGTAIDAYFTPLAVPETVLTVNDRLAIRVFVNASSKTITLHTQNGHLCEVITTFTAGLTALNGLQAQVQNFATGTTGTDFDIVSSGSTHTFNLPSASATARGVVTKESQTFAGDKTFTGAIVASNLSNTNTGDNATNTQYSGLAASKQDVITLTTTGTSGASTLIGATLNIPQYSGATNLGYTAAPTDGTVTSSTGTSATLPLADATNAGLLKPAKFTVLENTSGTNTGDQDLSSYAPLASPTFTGTPLAPTPTSGDNSTKLATTEYVDRQIGLGGSAYNILISSFPGNAITTETLGTSNGVSYSQNGRNVMINNGATAITITANTLLTPTDFIASYTRLGSATITFLFTGTGATLIQPNGNMLTGSPGSTALLTKNGTTIYLLINNI